MLLDANNKLKCRKLDNMVACELLIEAIIAHDLPFKFVEFEKIRNWVKYLNPDAINISRNTTKADVMKI